MSDIATDELILHERIAAGGMGEIFRATQNSVGGFSKTVAVKRILPGYSGDEVFAKMFVREATISSKLQHPNILQVYRSGQSEDGLYLVMELIDGQGIDKLLRKIADRNLFVPPGLCCHIMAEAAKGLEFAHSLTDGETGELTPVIHRDISPSNIMISYNGEVKLLDFGFAKIANMSSLTTVGEIKGKAAYFAPEVLDGKEASTQSDLFSLGVVFFELISGHPLFRADTPMLAMAKIQKCEIPPFSQYRSDVSPKLEKVVRKLLARDPENRFRSAGELQRTLTQLLADEFAGTLASDLADYMKTIFSSEIRHLKELRSNATATQTISIYSNNARSKSASWQRWALLILLITNLGMITYFSNFFSLPKGLLGEKTASISKEQIMTLPGLIGWFNAEDVPGANDTPIGIWQDLSGQGNDLVQNQAALQPHIRRSTGAQRCTMLFDGSREYFQNESLARSLQQARGATFFYVARSYGSDVAQYVWSVHASDRQTDILRAGFSPGGKTARLKVDEAIGHNLESDPILPQELACYEAVFGDKEVSLFQNGVQILSSPIMTAIPFVKSAYFSLGQEWDGVDKPSGFLKGDISEILIFERVLDATEVVTIRNYLRARYGCGVVGSIGQ